MTFLLYDYLDEHGESEIQPWLDKLQKKERAKIDEKLDALQMYGEELRPHVLADTNERSILKLRVQGGVKLRPLLCRGPIDAKAEYTLLAGAKEVGFVLQPKGVEKLAVERRNTVINEPNSRRAINAHYAK